MLTVICVGNILTNVLWLFNQYFFADTTVAVAVVGVCLSDKEVLKEVTHINLLCEFVGAFIRATVIVV